MGRLHYEGCLRYAAGTAMTTCLSYSYNQEFPQLARTMLRELLTVQTWRLSSISRSRSILIGLRAQGLGLSMGRLHYEGCLRYAAGTAMTTCLSYSYNQEFPQLARTMLRELLTVQTWRLSSISRSRSILIGLRAQGLRLSMGRPHYEGCLRCIGTSVPIHALGRYAAGTAMTTCLSYSYNQEFPQLARTMSAGTLDRANLAAQFNQSFPQHIE